MDKNTIFCWDRFINEGDILFNYMIHNFDKMFDGKLIIKHFDIESGFFGLFDYIDDIKEQYNDNIQQELIHWIQKEFNNKELFQETNWRPFRDQDILTCMFLGYRRMFQYKHYIFQLILNSSCENCDVCNYCKNNEDCTLSEPSSEREMPSGERSSPEGTHFGLSFYGWKDKDYMKLQPYNNMSLSDDNVIPEQFWLYNLK
jgi:hypothetical protein